MSTRKDLDQVSKELLLYLEFAESSLSLISRIEEAVMGQPESLGNPSNDVFPLFMESKERFKHLLLEGVSGKLIQFSLLLIDPSKVVNSFSEPPKTE